MFERIKFTQNSVVVISMMAIFFVAIFSTPVGAQYGGESYGECQYNEVGCNQASQPDPEPEPEPEPEPDQVENDVDGDDNSETAVDSNGDDSDGYEEYNDDDDSSTATPVDGDDDGKTDYIIDTDDDGDPDVYWDPDDEVVDELRKEDVDDDGNDEYIFDNDGDGEEDSVYDSEDDSVEDYGDEEEKEKVTTVDGDDDGDDEYFSDDDGDGVPDVYVDEDDNIVSDVGFDDPDGDGEDEWLYDSDGDGVFDRYYDPVSGLTFPLELIEDNDDGETAAVRAVTGERFGGQVYEEAGEQLRKVPEPVAYSFPYIIFFLIALFAIRFVIQERREVARIRHILAYVEEQKRLFFEKNNFLMLISHYLRTPLTTIKAGSELMFSKATPEQQQDVQRSNSAIKNLGQTVEDILGDVNNQQAIQGIEADTRSTARVLAVTAPRFIIPLIMAGIFVILLKFMFIDFRVTVFSWVSILIEVILAILIVQWFYAALRKRQIAKQNRNEKERLLEEEEAIDRARTNVIEQAKEKLKQSLLELQAAIGAFRNDQRFKSIRKGLADFNGILTKFTLLSQLQLHKVAPQATLFNTYDVFTGLFDEKTETITQKQIHMEIDQVEHTTVLQNQGLLEYVLSSVLDNAIKYSEENGTVEIFSHVENGHVEISIRDHGPGIDKDKLDILFKPFSRAESAERFDKEGMGFDLYLDRVIMHYLGGEIDIDTEVGSGTVVHVNFPVNLEAV